MDRPIPPESAGAWGLVEAMAQALHAAGEEVANETSRGARAERRARPVSGATRPRAARPARCAVRQDCTSAHCSHGPYVVDDGIATPICCGPCWCSWARIHGLKREPGGHPGLPRSGNRERPPRSALALGSTRTGKRWSVGSRRRRSARKPEDLPASGDGRHPRPVRPGSLEGGWAVSSRRDRFASTRSSVPSPSFLFQAPAGARGRSRALGSRFTGPRARRIRARSTTSRFSPCARASRRAVRHRSHHGRHDMLSENQGHGQRRGAVAEHQGRSDPRERSAHDDAGHEAQRIDRDGRREQDRPRGQPLVASGSPTSMRSASRRRRSAASTTARRPASSISSRSRRPRR